MSLPVLTAVMLVLVNVCIFKVQGRAGQSCIEACAAQAMLCEYNFFPLLEMVNRYNQHLFHHGSWHQYKPMKAKSVMSLGLHTNLKKQNQLLSN